MEIIDTASLYLQAILRNLSQGLLVPVMIVLVALVLYAICSLGSLVAEYFAERRHFRVVAGTFIDRINDAPADGVNEVIRTSGLLRDQQKALITVADSRALPSEDLFALAKAELTRADDRYKRITGRNDMAAKVGPMIGLLGTLIPLGPGIVALGQARVDILASSLLVAFDTTIAGLAAAVVFLLVSRIRKRWYARYMLAIETGMRCILQKAEQEHAVGLYDDAARTAAQKTLTDAQRATVGLGKGATEAKGAADAGAAAKAFDGDFAMGEGA